jgi:hypothetical protein
MKMNPTVRCALIALALGGCDRLLGLKELPIDARISDADDRSDTKTTGDAVSAGDATPGCLGKFGAGGAGLYCTKLQPTMVNLVVPSTFNTTTSNLCQMDTQSEGTTTTTLCVVVANDITVSTVVVTGSRPLVLVATDKISVAGTMTILAGSDWLGCSATVSGAGSTSGGAGGAGGSFRGTGGAGGSLSSAKGGAATQGQTPMTVHGGCHGGVGGDLLGGATGGFGGGGGGALYLIAGHQITITGRINASGLPGNGGDPSGDPGGVVGGAGGGGGGAGGLIGIDAPMVSLAQGVVLVANGAGGGGGGGVTQSGMNGSGTQVALPQMTPHGGPGGDNAERGGDGAAGTVINGESMAQWPRAGGGGGGGGGGAILVYSLNVPVNNAVISPAQPLN